MGCFRANVLDLRVARSPMEPRFLPPRPYCSGRVICESFRSLGVLHDMHGRRQCLYEEEVFMVYAVSRECEKYVM